MSFFLLVLMVLIIEVPTNFSFAISKGESNQSLKNSKTPAMVYSVKGGTGTPLIYVAPPVNACTYYPPNRLVRDIFRLQFQKRTCQSIPGIDKKLLDRPETETYKVGDPFDVPRRN